MARGSGIGTDDGLLVAGTMNLTVDREHRDGNFQHNGVHVETGHRIGSVVVGVIGILLRRQHATNSHAEVEGIEGRAKIDEEWIIYCPGENAYAIAQFVNSLVEQ